MKEVLLIYTPNVINTYLYYIKTNLELIAKIIDEREKSFEPYNHKRKDRFFVSRAKHIQIMNLIGITAENLIKIILLKRGFVLNTAEIGTKFNDSFMDELNNINEEQLSQRDLDSLYDKAKKEIDIEINTKLISFDRCIDLFNRSNPESYYNGVGTYVLNPYPDIYNNDEYLGRKEIRPSDALKIIQKMRNSYLHRAEAQDEQNGIVWYFYNFLIWILNKEYPSFIGDLKYIGSEDNKNKFQNKG